jgi:hypothetical protein
MNDSIVSSIILSLEFWNDFKKNPSKYLGFCNEVEYIHISAFVNAYLAAIEDISNYPFYFRMRYWFLAKHDWKMDCVWSFHLYHFHYKRDEKKSIRKIFREMILFLEAEIKSLENDTLHKKTSLVKEVNFTINSNVNVSIAYEGQPSKREIFSLLLLWMVRFQTSPRAFAGMPSDDRNKYCGVFAYLTGMLYGLSHFSGEDYSEKFRQKLFARNQYSVGFTEKDTWQQFILEVLANNNQEIAINLAFQNIVLFIGSEMENTYK